jgi:uncharacterized protein (TIGR02246 family)
MKRSLAIVGLIGIAAGLSAAALAARSGGGDKQAIAALEQRIAKAAEAKDAKAILANFAKGDSLVVFDVIPPLECRGQEAYLKNWQSALSGCADNPTMKIDNLAIETEGTLAYSTSIQHFTCTDSKGNKSTVTLRATDVYRKADGKWLIVHEHYSVPVDLDTAKADLNSKP